MTKQYKTTWLVAAILATGAGCKVSSGTTMSTTPGAVPASGESGGAGAGGPSCETPADHCLQADDVLVSEPFQSGYVGAQLGKQTAPPNSSGEATFTILADGSTKTSRVAYRTHRAAPGEIRLGALVASLDAATSENIYRAPTSRQEAMESNWFVARIVSVDPMVQGHVIVSGGYKVAADALRIVDGDSMPAITSSGTEDAAFLKPEHWVVGTDALPASGYIGVRAAVAIQPPSAKTRDEGEFLITATGERTWSRHAWRSRAATAGDLKLGAHLLVLDAANSDNVYRSPESRVEALSSNWFVAKITDTSELFKGVVTVSGGYRVDVKAARVLVK